MRMSLAAQVLCFVCAGLNWGTATAEAPDYRAFPLTEEVNIARENFAEKAAFSSTNLLAANRPRRRFLQPAPPVQRVVLPQRTSTSEPVPTLAKPSPPATQVVAKESLSPLDLTKFYRTPASEFAENTRYPWRDVPRGLQTLGNIPMEIGGQICVRGEENAKRGLVFPDKIEGIPVGRKFSALYVYHCAFFDSPVGTPISKLVWKYTDGTSFEKEIQYGVHVQDWFRWDTDPVDLQDPRSKRVWAGTNTMWRAEERHLLQFFITEIDNPKPELEVASIDLVSAFGKSSWCVLALTTGPAGQLKSEANVLEAAMTAKQP